MVRRLPTRWPALAISLSFHCYFRLGFVIDLQKLTLIMSQVMIHLGGPDQHSQGSGFSLPGQTETLVYATQELWTSPKSQLSAFDRWQGFWHLAMSKFPFAYSITILC